MTISIIKKVSCRLYFPFLFFPPTLSSMQAFFLFYFFLFRLLLCLSSLNIHIVWCNIEVFRLRTSQQNRAQNDVQVFPFFFFYIYRVFSFSFFFASSRFLVENNNSSLPVRQYTKERCTSSPFLLPEPPKNFSARIRTTGANTYVTCFRPLVDYFSYLSHFFAIDSM